jgi:hypothetical protein
MNAEQKQNLATLNNQELPINDRLKAVKNLEDSGNSELIPELKNFLARQRPPVKKSIDYDPLVNERICDIGVIGALHKLGDDSQWQYLLSSIESATNGLGQQIKESEYAASIVVKIGSSDLIAKVVELCGNKSPRTVINTVKTLEAINLPKPATRQSIAEIAGFLIPHEFVPLKLVQYFNQAVKWGDGDLLLTEDAKAYLNADDYQISNGQPEQTTISEVLKIDLPIYKLTYYVENEKAYICTFPEAAQRWLSWWANNGSRLAFAPERSQFILK